MGVRSDGRYVFARLVHPVGWITLIDSDSGERWARCNCESLTYWCIGRFTGKAESTVHQDRLLFKYVVHAKGHGVGWPERHADHDARVTGQELLIDGLAGEAHLNINWPHGIAVCSGAGGYRSPICCCTRGVRLRGQLVF